MKKLIIKNILGLIIVSSLNAEEIIETEIVKVIKSIPISSYEEISIPQRNCYYVQEPVISSVPIQYYERTNYNRNYNNSGNIIGGVLGGVIGHQFGGGSGKTAATIGGAVLGTMIGSTPTYSNSYYEPVYRTRHTSYETVQKCSTSYRVERREVKGFQLYGNYKGKEITKYSESNDKEIILEKIINY